MSYGFDHVLVTSQGMCGQVWSYFGLFWLHVHLGHTRVSDVCLSIFA